VVRMKILSKTVFSLYLLTLLWLVLFKFSFDLASVLLDYQSRSLNLIPFAGFSQGSLREMIDNLIVFIPLGLLLNVNFKQVAFWPKLAFVFVFSLAAEVIQFVFAIGTTDITDVIMNTLGGLVGLAFYSLGKKYIDIEKLDRFIVIVGVILLVAFILLRTFVFRVRY
jgi:glycopeptide antibiotics resistance protein